MCTKINEAADSISDLLTIDTSIETPRKYFLHFDQSVSSKTISVAIAEKDGIETSEITESEIVEIQQEKEIIENTLFESDEVAGMLSSEEDDEVFVPMGKLVKSVILPEHETGKDSARAFEKDSDQQYSNEL